MDTEGQLEFPAQRAWTLILGPLQASVLGHPSWNPLSVCLSDMRSGQGLFGVMDVDMWIWMSTSACSRLLIMWDVAGGRLRHQAWGSM